MVKPFADNHVLEFAKISDLIILPVGISEDDLEPTLKLATELINKGIPRTALLFVVCKVMEGGEIEAEKTCNSIKNWTFNVAEGWIPMRTSYSQAMDAGYALTETKYKTLNKKIDSIIQQIVNKAILIQSDTAKEGA